MTIECGTQLYFNGQGSSALRTTVAVVAVVIEGTIAGENLRRSLLADRVRAAYIGSRSV